MTRTAALLASCLLLLAACGGEAADSDATAPDRTVRTDADGNVILEGADWSGTGTGEARATGSVPADDGDVAAVGDGSGEEGVYCGVPTTTAEQGEAAPPGFDPNAPLSQPANDFPVRGDVSPTEGDRGTEVTVTVVAPGQPEALTTMFVRFRDGDHHGMRAAKFTDAAGRAVFEGPIPQSAPAGLAKIALSVSKQDGSSGLDVVDFVVTGPECVNQ